METEEKATQLELPLEVDEAEEAAKIWAQRQTPHHLRAEARDYITLFWSERMASALDRLPPGTRGERLSGTLRAAGHLQDVILFLDDLAQQRCSCRAKWEEKLDPQWREVPWLDRSEDHDCVPRRAKDLLTLLKEG